MGNPTPQKKSIPRSIRFANLKELYILCGVPIWKLELIASDEFRPSISDRKKLTKASLPFYKWNPQERRQAMQRVKYRALRPFLSMAEKSDLLDHQNAGDAYDHELNRLVNKYWDRICGVFFETGEED